MRISDSVWHKRLSAVPDETRSENSPYWLWPFQTYKTFCPYLVGSYDEVADYLRCYILKGFRTFILDIPRSSDDLECARVSFSRAFESEPT
jgi:alkanesulfonate monooxygenase